MRKKKTLQELTIRDNFMFAAVMLRPENCRRLLEMALGIEVAQVAVSREKSIVYHPEYRGVRLDVYVRDEKNTHYNVEMQVSEYPLARRSRYYHSQLDMELLTSGAAYEELPDVYVIFICDYDPFGLKKYRYTFEKRCEEAPEVKLMDGSRSVFLSTYGENPDEVSAELVKFLSFVRAGLEESTEDFGDDYVLQLQESIREIKISREMRERYMVLEEMLKEERHQGRAEGKAESVLELLEELGEIPADLQAKIMAEKDLSVLSEWHKKAARAESVEQFCRQV